MMVRLNKQDLQELAVWWEHYKGMLKDTGCWHLVGEVLPTAYKIIKARDKAGGYSTMDNYPEFKEMEK